MALAIQTNVAALTAQANLEAHIAQLGEAATGRAGLAAAALSMAAGDSAAVSSNAAVPVPAPVDGPQAAAELAQQTHAHIVGDPAAAVAAQGGVSAEATLALLQ